MMCDWRGGSLAGSRPGTSRHEPASKVDGATDGKRGRDGARPRTYRRLDGGWEGRQGAGRASPCGGDGARAGSQEMGAGARDGGARAGETTLDSSGGGVARSGLETLAVWIAE